MAILWKTVDNALKTSQKRIKNGDKSKKINHLSTNVCLFVKISKSYPQLSTTTCVHKRSDLRNKSPSFCLFSLIVRNAIFMLDTNRLLSSIFGRKGICLTICLTQIAEADSHVGSRVLKSGMFVFVKAAAFVFDQSLAYAE